MASDIQLNDVKRFCCNPVEFDPFTVDPTFDIGKFNVIPITYQYLVLENKRDGKYLSLAGPVLLHERKTEETYSTFSATLRTLELSRHFVRTTNRPLYLVFVTISTEL